MQVVLCVSEQSINDHHGGRGNGARVRVGRLDEGAILR